MVLGSGFGIQVWVKSWSRFRLLFIFSEFRVWGFGFGVGFRVWTFEFGVED